MRESRELSFANEPPTFVYLYIDHHHDHHEPIISFLSLHITVLSPTKAGLRSLERSEFPCLRTGRKLVTFSGTNQHDSCCPLWPAVSKRLRINLASTHAFLLLNTNPSMMNLLGSYPYHTLAALFLGCILFRQLKKVETVIPKVFPYHQVPKAIR